MIADVGLGLAGFLILILALCAYFVPTIIAAARHHHNIGSILVINLLLGWTFLGWVVALAMSVGEVHSRPQAVVAQAGWYPDPHGPGQRWWDGVSWTEHIR